jgi:hypothetical protein
VDSPAAIWSAAQVRWNASVERNQDAQASTYVTSTVGTSARNAGMPPRTTPSTSGERAPTARRAAVSQTKTMTPMTAAA